MMTSLHAFMSEKLRATETCNYLHINGIDIFDVSQGYCVTSRLNHAHIMMDTMQHLWRYISGIYVVTAFQPLRLCPNIAILCINVSGG